MQYLIFCVFTLVLLANLTFAIYKGTEAKRDQFKYIVRLSLNLENGYRSSCGGCVIAPNWVLTAAHCLAKNVDSVDIYFDTIKRNIAPTIVNVEKNKFKSHPQFLLRSMRNDIALIEVAVDNSNNSIIPISMPKKDYNYKNDDNVTVSGWGRMGITNEITKDLQWATMQTMSNQKCIDMYGPYLVKQSSNICLKSKDNSSICPGDSGGPAVRLTDHGEEELVGLISFGTHKTCQHGMPAVLTRANKYLEWISHITGIAF